MNDSAGEIRQVGEARFRVLRTREQIAEDTLRIARDLKAIAGERTPVFIGLLKGCLVLLADLIRAYDGAHEIDFLSVTRYNPKQKDPHSVRVLHDLATNIDGRLVIVVEGIRSRGTKVEYVDRFLRIHGADRIHYCAMVRQKGSLRGPVPLDAWGFEIEDDQYVVGYGLDLDEVYRNLPFIGVMEESTATGRAG
jgi:hypoxanthine phosphoribosyltransferase